MKFVYQARYYLLFFLLTLIFSGYLFHVGLEKGWNYPLEGRDHTTQPVYVLFFLSVGFSLFCIFLLIALATGRLKR